MRRLQKVALFFYDSDKKTTEMWVKVDKGLLLLRSEGN